MDTIFGDKLRKYVHFRLVIMDKSHCGRFIFGGKEVSIHINETSLYLYSGEFGEKMRHFENAYVKSSLMRG